ncbi:MAG TPA: alpha/beta hydrolase [Candidatus Acidoferrales bacterium]|nr:alpha/beta hydrolase [Candidatus Acidoferrales bacterium]
MEWRKLAPVLAQEFSVVMTDLRGYGDSSKPPDGENHAGYSKRAMAQDQVEVMEHLGFRKFAVVGHDRGGRVGHRLARDFPGRVTKLAVIDIVPTYTVYHDLTQQSATALFHWFLLIQPEPFPETLIGNSADFFLKSMMLRGAHPAWMEKEALDEYLRCFRDPAHIHAMCEDYRASASIDLAHDEANLSERIACPLLVLWGKEGPIGRFYNPLDVWRQRASNVKGQQIPGRHFLPEESPREVLEQLKSFLHS